MKPFMLGFPTLIRLLPMFRRLNVKRTKGIKRLWDKHMVRVAKDEAILEIAGNFLRGNEKARSILDDLLSVQREDLTETLCHRVANRQTAAALALCATSAIGRAIFLWRRLGSTQKFIDHMRS